MSTIEKAAARLAERRRSAAEARRHAPGAAAAPDAPPAGLPVTPAFVESAGAAASVPVPPDPAPLRSCRINLAALRERGFLTPDGGRTKLAKEMRRIKRPLLLNIQKARALEDAAATAPTNTIMITSASPGEGKTFTAINLAMSLAAEVDRRVLLVDADVARGDIARQLGIEPARGLSDLLQQHRYIAGDGELASNVERLSVLPSGRPSDQIDELFASEMMAELVQELAAADPRRVVIFDASPLLATTEAAVLARLVGQTVVVVEAGKTPQDALARAVAQLDGCDNVSLVLNKATVGDASSYGYGYGYGYDADGAADPARRDDAAGEDAAR